MSKKKKNNKKVKKHFSENIKQFFNQLFNNIKLISDFIRIIDYID
jgi:hypothetical protein